MARNDADPGTNSNQRDPPIISQHPKKSGVSRQGEGMNARSRHWGIAILRVMVGIVFLAHGGQKVFVYGFSGVQGAFGQMGIPMPTVMGPFVALLELVGGVMLVLGVGTRWVSILFAVEMAVAVLKVHLSAGFFLPRGFEFALTMCAASCALALEGPGPAALGRILSKKGVGTGTLVDPV
jgi:putative oxidoreductase